MTSILGTVFSGIGNVRRRAVRTAVVLPLLLFFSMAPPARGQFAVIDVANLSQNTQQAQQSLLQLVRLYQQLTLMYQNLEKIEDPNWRELFADFQQWNELASQGAALAYSDSGVFGEFRSVMPGFVGMEPGTFESVWAAWTDMTLDTLAASLDSVSAQAEQYDDTQLQLLELKAIADSASGNVEALNAANMLLGHMAEEIAKLNQVLAATIQGQNVALGMELNMQANLEATGQELIDESIEPFHYYDGQGGFTGLPLDWPYPCPGCP